MSKKTVYKPAPKSISSAIFSSEIKDDFLPSPKNLVRKEETQKITILLSKSSVSYFKEQAKKLDVPYQTMIKNVLDRYTAHYRSHTPRDRTAGAKK